MTYEDGRSATTPPGVCPEPMSWETLRRIVEDGSLEQMRRLGRSEATLQSYHEFKARTAKYYESPMDLIMIKVFKCDWTVNDNNKFVHVPVSRSSEQKGPFFVPNDFPYHTVHGIEHWILWSDRVLDRREVHAFLRADSTARGAAAQLTFVNPVELQSIPDVHHVHVMLLSASAAESIDADVPPPTP